MILSINIEFFGECGSVLDFYKSIFDNVHINFKTYNDMEMADFLGISGNGLKLIWQSVLDIGKLNRRLRFEMSDSLLTAMNKETDMKGLFYNPVICIKSKDDSYVKDLLKKIYTANQISDEIKKGTVPDRYGIKWKYEEGDDFGFLYSLTFEGFCQDVITYYQEAFMVKALHIIKYKDTAYADKISEAGLNMIYNAILEFKDGDNIYALKLSDDLCSAITGVNSYDENALLFYHGQYNPTLTLKGTEEDGLKYAFEKLMDGGKVNRQLSPQDKAVDYGSLIDKYGICWNIYISKL